MVCCLIYNASEGTK